MADSSMNTIEGKKKGHFPDWKPALHREYILRVGLLYIRSSLKGQNTYANVFRETNCADEILCFYLMAPTYSNRECMHFKFV